MLGLLLPSGVAVQYAAGRDAITLLGNEPELTRGRAVRLIVRWTNHSARSRWRMEKFHWHSSKAECYHWQTECPEMERLRLLGMLPGRGEKMPCPQCQAIDRGEPVVAPLTEVVEPAANCVPLSESTIATS
jgi:hypothetical protein